MAKSANPAFPDPLSAKTSPWSSPLPKRKKNFKTTIPLFGGQTHARVTSAHAGSPLGTPAGRGISLLPPYLPTIVFHTRFLRKLPPAIPAVNRLQRGVYRFLRRRRYLPAGSKDGGRLLRWRDDATKLRRRGFFGRRRWPNVDTLSPLFGRCVLSLGILVAKDQNALTH